MAAKVTRARKRTRITMTAKKASILPPLSTKFLTMVILFLVAFITIILPTTTTTKTFSFLGFVESFHLSRVTRREINSNILQPNIALTKNRNPCCPRKISSYSHSAPLYMCICIDCKFVTDCKAYHFVETKHQQPHMTDTPTFLPREGSPTINVNIRTEQNRDIENEKDEKVSLWMDEIEQLKIINNNNKNNDSTSTTSAAASSITDTDINTNTTNNTDTVMVVPTTTTTRTTIEYDVVKCADFVRDQDCWVRNMPEEIKRLNPEFVPS